MNPIDYQYIHLLSSQLEGFKQVGKNFNFRCPICGDSEKNRKKRRGWILTNNEVPVFYCHNCGASLPFQKFLEQLNPILYKEYLYDVIKESNSQREPSLPFFDVAEKEPICDDSAHSLLKVASCISDLSESHEAVLYLKSRKIPEEKFKYIYWIDNMQKVKELDERDEYKIIDTDGRIVFPQFGKNTLIGINCRSIKKNVSRRYLNFKFKNEPMIFGLFDIDGNLLIKKDAPVFITEGAADSLFLDNCIAVNGADLTRVLKVLDSYNLVFIPDNEPRNIQILKGYEKIINIGTNIVIFPKTIQQKDINAMVLHHGKSYVRDVVSHNIYSGIKAKLKLSDWRRS